MYRVTQALCVGGEVIKFKKYISLNLPTHLVNILCKSKSFNVTTKTK